MTKADHPENKPYSPLDEAAELLDVIRKLTLELHPHRMGTLIVTLDSSLDHDLGYDSLGRIELLARIEEKFGVGISEQALAGAETPKDLLRALITAQPAKSRKERIDVHDLKLGDVEETPGSAQTLLDVIGWHVKAHAERPHVLYYDEEQQLHELTYRQLWDRSEALAAGLIKAGLEPGQTVAIMLPTCLEYFYSFAGVLMAGGIPVPIYPPVRASQIEDHLRRHAGILANARTRVLITIPEAKIAARLLRMQVETLDSITTPEELSLPGMAVPPAHVTGEHLAHIQYTSGSTGNPKGVMLTHSNLLANVRAMGENLRVDSTDVFVSWLPLYHDMGLIGAWMGSMYFAMPLVLMSPLSFLAHPERWLMAIHRHRGTLSGSPNFAYELLLRRVSDEQLKGLDLSSWRAAFNGAEPVVPGTIHRFIERFSAYGLRSQSVMPVYGLAEASVGLAFPPPDREPIIDRVKRDIFMTQGLAELAEEDDPNVLEFVACGQPLPRHEVRIVDDSGLELGEGEEGRLEFKGPSVTSGYYRNPEATRDLFNGEWVDSGDQAYIRGGDVYLTGRRKDIIIRAGRNIYPHELEEAVGNLEGIRKGCVAVFGTTDRGSGTEKLVVLAESRVSDPKKQEELRREIESRALDLLGNPVDDIVLVPPHSVPKTSSGKIRRASSKELYENGASAVVRRAVWLQVARLWLAGLAPQWRRWRKLVSTWLFGIYWLICLPLLATPVWLLTALVPVKGWVWWISRLGARLLFRLGGVSIKTRGLENLPRDQSSVVVVNHMSYLDGLALVAGLPGQWSFVAKNELLTSFIARVYLRRLGTQFVERFDKQRGVEDARRVSRSAVDGHSLVVFPEGTFRRNPGLLPFHMGAFHAAVEAGVPVVPTVLRGTRSILRADQWLPRSGRITITVLEPILPEGEGWAAAIHLRDRAREVMLRMSGEPDLAGELRLQAPKPSQGTGNSGG